MKEKYQKWNIKYFTTSDYDKYTNNIPMQTLKKVNESGLDEKMKILATKK